LGKNTKRRKDPKRKEKENEGVQKRSPLLDWRRGQDIAM
jgi:hypothetical protein